MENLKKSRASLRGIFTKAANKLEELFKEEKLAKKDLNMHLTNVEQKAEQIADLDRQINDLMMGNTEIGEDAFAEAYELSTKID